MDLLQSHQGSIPGPHYLASTLETVCWGWLPRPGDEPACAVASGDTITIDTVSHEGILEDQGRDPVAFFAAHGVAAGDVLEDAVLISKDHPARDPAAGPHVVTGPVGVEGARPGDVLRVDFLDLLPRAPYGVISSRHGYGALPGEIPAMDGQTGPQTAVVSTFCQVDPAGDRAAMPLPGGRRLGFDLAPFLGLVGVTADTAAPLNSVPPGPFGGNLDIRDLTAGATLYLPVQVNGAGFYVGDPHFAQGHGEIALTAMEAPLRATVRLTVIPAAAAAVRTGRLAGPFAETPEHWIAVGLDRDLDEAMRSAVREALRFLAQRHSIPQEQAYAYLSAAGDFVVTQVVDDVKGVHCLIRKRDFA